jgi:hypothetical protein
MTTESNFHSEILGSSNSTRSFIVNLLEAQRFRSYKFTAEAEYEKGLQENFRVAIRTYIDEIFYRAHFSALVGLARTHTWCEAIRSSEENGNYFGVCASLRGLLESTADINHSLNPTVSSLAHNFSTILSCYNEKEKRGINMGVIEDALIHFMYARRIEHDEKENFPVSHRDEKIAKYLKGIEGVDDKIWKLYGALCEITHPAADSILLFEKYDHTDRVLSFSWNSDQSNLIKELASNYREAIDAAVSIGYNTPLSLLGVLNEFGLSKVATNYLQKFSLDWMPAWKKLKASIEQSKLTNRNPIPSNVVLLRQ